MERGSDKHGARVDEAMASEVEPIVRGAPVDPRVEDHRVLEDAEDATAAHRVTAADPVAERPTALPEDEVHDRSELARHLLPGALPADREALVAMLDGTDASPELRRRVGSLPPGREFATVADIWEALGGGTEHRTTPDDLAEA